MKKTIFQCALYIVLIYSFLEIFEKNFLKNFENGHF